MRIEDFIAQVNELINSTSARALIGIVGKPGAGKSTIVETIKSHFPQNVISIVSMDGFHLSNEILEATGKRERKGAPDTFDQEGFIALLTHLKTGGEDIHFPIFHLCSQADELPVIRLNTLAPASSRPLHPAASNGFLRQFQADPY